MTIHCLDEQRWCPQQQCSRAPYHPSGNADVEKASKMPRHLQPLRRLPTVAAVAAALVAFDVAIETAMSRKMERAEAAAGRMQPGMPLATAAPRTRATMMFLPELTAKTMTELAFPPKVRQCHYFVRAGCPARI